MQGEGDDEREAPPDYAASYSHDDHQHGSRYEPMGYNAPAAPPAVKAGGGLGAAADYYRPPPPSA